MKKLILFVSIFLTFASKIYSQEVNLISSIKQTDLFNIHCELNGTFYLWGQSSWTDPYIFKSMDFGKNWEIIYKDISNVPKYTHKDVSSFTVQDSIIVLGLDTGYIKVSYDYGKNWDLQQFKFSKASPREIRFNKLHRSKVGCAMTYYDFFLTNDAWKTNENITIPDSMTYFGEHKIYFISLTMPDDSSIFIAGTDYSKHQSDTFYLISSYDRGKTWKMTSTNLNIANINSYGNDFVVAQGINERNPSINSHSILYYTSDRGENWNKIIDTIFPKFGVRYLQNISFLDKDNFAMTYGTFLFVTHDKAKTWEFIEFNKLSSPIVRVNYVNKDMIIVLSDYEDIYQYNPNKTDVEEELILINNICYYPNPTKDILNIKLIREGLALEELESEMLANKDIEIYDLMGQKILTQKFENTHTIINIQELSKGIYFCKIKQNGAVFKFEVVK